MNLSLFSDNLLLGCTVVATLLGVITLSRLRTRPNFYRQLAIAGGVGLGLGGFSLVAINQAFTLQNIPNVALIVGFGVFGFLTIGLLNLGRGWRVSGLAGIAGLSWLILLVLTTNRFYHFYPTLSSVVAGQHQTYSRSQLTIIRSKAHSVVAQTLEQQIAPPLPESGSVYNLAIAGKTSGFVARDAIVYLPPAYPRHATPTSHFPVLLLLGGTPGSPQDWLNGGELQKTANDFAARHHGISPLIIVVDNNGSFRNDTECVDSPKGNAEQYLTVDVPAYIKANFNVATNPQQWGIGGLSEGGMCAAMLTLRHQDVFRHFLDFGGDPTVTLTNSATAIQTLFKGSRPDWQEHSINWLLRNRPVDHGVSGQFVVGRNDNHAIVANLQATYNLARDRGLSATLEVIPGGGHSYQVWSQALKDSLPTLSYNLGATNCETGCSVN